MRARLAIAACCLPFAVLAEERALRKEVVVKAPLEAAWAAWTTSEGAQSFFAPEVVVNARPGGAYFVHFNPFAPPGLRGADDMRVLAVQPMRMISFTWNAPPHLADARPQKTVVIVRLEPEGDERTRVRLTHVGWGDGGQWDQAFEYFDRAWGRVMANLEKRFAEKPTDWEPVLAKVKAYEDAERNKRPTLHDRAVRVEKVIDAPPAQVWKAFSTAEGLRRWAAPVVAVDLRPGGWMRSHYDKLKSLGAPGTIHLDVLSVIEGELVTYKVNLTERFPAALRAEDAHLQEVVRLEPTADGRTRLVSVMTGWGAGRQWDDAYAFFAKGNEYTYAKLAALFTK